MSSGKSRIEIKFIGRELSGDVYITKRGIYVMDINFNPNAMDLYSMTMNDIDGEPYFRLNIKRFKVVKEFSS